MNVNYEKLTNFLTSSSRKQVLLTGESGSGKSTLIRKLVRERSGLALPLGYLPQNVDLTLELRHTAREELFLFGGDELALMGLEKSAGINLAPLNWRNANIRDLSGGERQRIAFTRLLFLNPKTLILDEPLTAVDVASVKEIAQFLVKWCIEKNVVLLVASHLVVWQNLLSWHKFDVKKTT